jgi:hypothetical protein
MALILQGYRSLQTDKDSSVSVRPNYSRIGSNILLIAHIIPGTTAAYFPVCQAVEAVDRRE